MLQAGDQFEVAVEVLDQGGAAFHEVAAIVIAHAVDDANGGVMDVPTKDALHAEVPGVADHRLLELADERHRVLDLVLHESAQRPIAPAEAAAQEVDRVIELEEGLVAHVADVGEPLDVLDHSVEFIAVDDEQAATVSGLVDGVMDDGEVAVLAPKIAHHLVVVAGNVDQAGALATLAEDLLHHVIVALGPVAATA